MYRTEQISTHSKGHHGFGGIWGSNPKRSGIIDSQTDVGGWPELNSTTPPADTDHDGMPNAWESINGLDPNDAADRNNLAADGDAMHRYLKDLKQACYAAPRTAKEDVMRDAEEFLNNELASPAAELSATSQQQSYDHCIESYGAPSQVAVVSRQDKHE